MKHRPRAPQAMEMEWQTAGGTIPTTRHWSPFLSAAAAITAKPSSASFHGVSCMWGADAWSSPLEAVMDLVIADDEPATMSKGRKQSSTNHKPQPKSGGVTQQ